jgi:hypothetical protein
LAGNESGKQHRQAAEFADDNGGHGWVVPHPAFVAPVK